MIPDEMKNIPQWVISKSGAKQPFQTNGYPASVSNPETWATYDEAAAAVKQGVGDHVGFVFTEDQGIVGIDIDVGFCASGILNDLSIDCMNACESFTERSRSGRGIHIYVRGTLPFKGANNRAGVEIYKTGRYFICTGDALVYKELKSAQKGIDYIVDTYFTGERHLEEYSFKVPIYTPTYKAPQGNTIFLAKTNYPPIGEGCRNISLASFAGQLRTAGYGKDEILAKLLECNEQACDPPLPRSEVVGITNSIFRYH